MSTFKSMHSRRTVDINASIMGASVVITLSDFNSRDIVLDPADAPAIALAILEAAHPDRHLVRKTSASYARAEAINWLITARDRAEAETKRSARNKRRDDLAKKFKVPGYIRDSPFGKLVDHYLDLEDEAAK